MENFNIKSFILIPMLRFNEHVKVLGALVLCSSKPREWTQEEIDLLQVINSSVITVIWELYKIKEIEELRNIFMTTLAHDLQVPLVGEHKALEFLLSRPSEKSIGTYKDIIEGIIKNNEDLYGLLTKMINSYNYEAGNQVLKLEYYDLASIIYDVISKLKGLAESKSMKIEAKIQKDLPKIRLDREEIKTVIYNLLENAILYTQQGGYIEISCGSSDNNVETCISDNGPGVRPEVRDRLFTRYEMTQAIDRKVGSGLGLLLSNQIVKAHGGKIWYKSEPEKGATFCFALPIENGENQ